MPRHVHHVGSCLLLACAAAQAAPQVSELTDLTLEQLSQVRITSVSRRTQTLAGAAGAVYVINAEDIRRSGATTLPQALRLAPNLHVAQADANQWAISARGFNGTLADKMLVMVDGRTVYSPLFSGVFWEAQAVMLADVERIEVMSGPGAVWGSNAVNGFINIITRAASDTQGSLLTLGGGNTDSLAGARLGGRLGEDGYYRVYGQRSLRDATRNAAGGGIGDAAQFTQGGFRADWGGPERSWTLQGDVYGGSIRQGATLAPRELAGGNLLARLAREWGDGASLRVQAYYDRTERDQPGAINDKLDTLDIDVQHSVPWGASQRWLWGGGYRFQSDQLVNLGPALAFLPASRDLRLGNVFAQDELALSPVLTLTLGLKLEHNDYTGLERLPSARLAWQPSPEQLLWLSASRAVRIPARLDRELARPALPPYTLLAPNDSFQSEVSNVIELGWRAQPSPALSYSATLFHQVFDRQRSVQPTPIGPVVANQIDGDSTGLEAWGSLRVSPRWRLTAGLMAQGVNLRVKPGAVSIGGTATLGNDPGQTWQLGSSWDLPGGFELDLHARHVGALPNPAVPAYFSVDARLGWRMAGGPEVSVVARNLFEPEHAEWGMAPQRPVYGRGMFVNLAWRLP